MPPPRTTRATAARALDTAAATADKAAPPKAAPQKRAPRATSGRRAKAAAKADSSDTEGEASDSDEEAEEESSGEPRELAEGRRIPAHTPPPAQDASFAPSFLSEPNPAHRQLQVLIHRAVSRRGVTDMEIAVEFRKAFTESNDDAVPHLLAKAAALHFAPQLRFIFKGDKYGLELGVPGGFRYIASEGFDMDVIEWVADMLTEIMADTVEGEDVFSKAEEMRGEVRAARDNAVRQAMISSFDAFLQAPSIQARSKWPVGEPSREETTSEAELAARISERYALTRGTADCCEDEASPCKQRAAEKRPWRAGDQPCPYYSSVVEIAREFGVATKEALDAMRYIRGAEVNKQIKGTHWNAKHAVNLQKKA